MQGVDIKCPEFGIPDPDECEQLDPQRWDYYLQATRGTDDVYAGSAVV